MGRMVVSLPAPSAPVWTGTVTIEHNILGPTISGNGLWNQPSPHDHCLSYLGGRGCIQPPLLAPRPKHYPGELCNLGSGVEPTWLRIHLVGSVACRVSPCT